MSIWASVQEETDYKTIITQIFDALNNGEYQRFLKYFDGKLIFVSPSGKTHDKTKLTKLYTDFNASFNNQNTEIQRIFVDGHTAVVDTIWSGIHIGEYDGINPSGKPFKVPVAWIFDFMYDKIITAKQFMDYHQLNKQSK